jgi:hypothetical protein
LEKTISEELLTDLLSLFIDKKKGDIFRTFRAKDRKRFQILVCKNFAINNLTKLAKATYPAANR